MAIGATGVGKSTLMNAVVQGAENMELNEDCDVAAKQYLTGANGGPVFEIGFAAKSCTEVPGYYVAGDVCFLDCPGLEDQDKTREYPNQTAVHYVQKRAASAMVFLVMSPDQFVNRGAVFVTQITGVAR